MTKFTPPVIKKDIDVKKTDVPPVNEIAKIDVVNTEGSFVEELAGSLPPKGAISGIDNGKGIMQMLLISILFRMTHK